MMFPLHFSFLYHILMEFNLQSAFSCINSSYILRLILIYTSQEKMKSLGHKVSEQVHRTGFGIQAFLTSPALSTVLHNSPTDTSNRAFYPQCQAFF